MHPGDRTVAIGKGAEPVLDQFDHLGAVGEAAGVSAETRVVDEIDGPGESRVVAGRLLIGAFRPAAQIRGLAFVPPSLLEYQNGRPANFAR